VLAPATTHDERDRPVLERVIATGAFRPVFQPVVELATRRVVGYEALTRFDDGTRPDLRFEQAAAAGLAVALERATLERAVAEATRLPPGPWLSVNASPSLLLERDALVAARAGADHSLVIELTERERVDDYEALADALRVVPDTLLAVDDAGAGYASLRHILTLHPAFIKLDITWVRDLDTDPARQALVAGISHFASVTNCRMVAEGVEPDAEVRALLQLGVELGQGYLFGGPEPADVHVTRAS
jgi:EAL domain-containing protein (putative c-di-GMP-specific phosphodiesterase class I)